MRASAASVTAPRADATIIASRSTPPAVSDATTPPAYRRRRPADALGKKHQLTTRGKNIHTEMDGQSDEPRRRAPDVQSRSGPACPVDPARPARHTRVGALPPTGRSDGP